MAYEYYNYPPATPKQPPSDGRPFGPGPRVPLWMISPWSRGGWVNSQVFDHTSVLLFLEKRFGVRPVAIWPFGGQIFFCNEPIATLDDLKGKTIAAEPNIPSRLPRRAACCG